MVGRVLSLFKDSKEKAFLCCPVRPPSLYGLVIATAPSQRPRIRNATWSSLPLSDDEAGVRGESLTTVITEMPPAISETHSNFVLWNLIMSGLLHNTTGNWGKHL